MGRFIVFDVWVKLYTHHVPLTYNILFDISSHILDNLLLSEPPPSPCRYHVQPATPMDSESLSLNESDREIEIWRCDTDDCSQVG